MSEETNMLLREIVAQLKELNRNIGGEKSVAVGMPKPTGTSQMGKDIEKMRQDILSKVSVNTGGAGAAGMMSGFGTQGAAGLGGGMPNVKDMIAAKRAEVEQKIKQGAASEEVVEDAE